MEPTGRYFAPLASDRRFSRLLAGSGGPSSRCSLRRKSWVRISSGSAFASFNSTKQTAGFDGNAEKNSSSAAASKTREKSSSNTCSEYYDSIPKNGRSKASSPGQSVFPCTLISRGNLGWTFVIRTPRRQFLKSFERALFERQQYYYNVIVTEYLKYHLKCRRADISRLSIFQPRASSL